MRRSEALEAIYPQLKDRIVVTNMGAVAVELYNLGHRPNFFYLEHAMGLASSIGLGLALCLPNQRIVVLDGDGSVLMNLGTLSTMARYRPKNLVHLIKQLRKDFDAPNANFVCASLGQTKKGSTDNGGKILNAMLAVDGRSGKYPEFKGNVAAV